MGNPRGVSRDFGALEKRRMRAIGLWERGETQAAVARRVGVVPQTVARCFQLPTSFTPIMMPSSMSVSRDMPRQTTVLPGGGSWVRAR